MIRPAYQMVIGFLLQVEDYIFNIMGVSHKFGSLVALHLSSNVVDFCHS